MNEGVSDIQSSGQYHILVGYGSNQAGWSEMIQVWDTDSNNEQFQAQTMYLLTQDDLAILSSSYASENKAIIVSPKSIRVYQMYHPDLNDEAIKPVTQLSIYSHNVRQATSACFTDKWMLIMGLTATDTTIKGFLIESNFESPKFDIGFPQNHGGTGQTKMIAIATQQGTGQQLKILQSISLHSGSAQTTLLNYVIANISDQNSLAATQALSLTFTDSFKCLYLSIDDGKASVVFIDSSSSLTVVLINLLDGSIAQVQKTEPIPHYSAYSKVSTADKLAFSKGWDYFIFGTTSQLTFFGHQVKFDKQIGFLMALTKNRINSIIKDTAAAPSHSKNSLTVTDLPGDPAQGYTLQLQSGEPKTTVDANINKVEFLNKNEWINSRSECKIEKSKEPIKQDCYYYELFEQYANLASSLKETAPKVTQACDVADGFVLTSYKKMSAADKSIRSVCFPNFIEQINNEIPTDSRGSKMVISDDKNYSLKWTSALNKEFINKDWFYQYSEWSDDFNKDFFSATVVRFSGMIVKNYVAKISNTEPWSYELKRPEKGSYFEVQVECLSKICPDFIRFNSTNTTFLANIHETNFRGNATYVYKIDTQWCQDVQDSQEDQDDQEGQDDQEDQDSQEGQDDQEDQDSQEGQDDQEDQDSQEDQDEECEYEIYNVWTLTIEVTAINYNVGINITMPFDIWYALNKNRIKYYSPPLQQDDIIKLSSKRVDLEVIQSKSGLSGQQKSVIAGWTEKQLEEAYEEAQKRLLQKPAQILFTSKMNASGLLTIEFSSPIQIPSYLLRELEKSKNVTKNGGRRLKIQQDVFFKQNDYKQNINANWAYKDTAILKVSTAFDQIQASKENATEDDEQIETSVDETTETQVNETSKTPVDEASDTLFFQNKETEGDEDSKNGPDDAQEQEEELFDENDPLDEDVEDEDEINEDQEEEIFDENDHLDEYVEDYDEINEDQEEELFDENDLDEYIEDEDEINEDLQTLEDIIVQVVQQSEFEVINQPQAIQACNPQQYFSDSKQSCVDIKIYFGSLQDLLNVFFERTQGESNLQMSYKVLSIDSNKIQVQLNFTDPLGVIPSDKLKILVGLGQLKNEQTESIVLTQPCVRQVVKNMATKAMNAVGNMSTAATAATVIGSAVLSTLVSGCLAQIWGMINGMQFIIHLPCLNVEFPQSAFEVIKKILMVATFDIPYLNMETVKKVYKLPEEDSIFDHPDQTNIRSNFEQLGYASKQISNNLGSVFVIVLVTTFLMLVILLTEPIKHPFVQKVNMKLKQKLLWNFVFRLVIESYLELGFSVYFNLRFARCLFSFLGSWVNYFYAVILAAVLIAAPLFVIFFYGRNFKRFKETDFESKFGSVYEGLNAKKRHAIAYLAIFMLRRALFTVISVIFYQNVILQLALAVYMQIASGCYIILHQPFEEQLMNRLEVMNEVFTLILIDLIFLFTPLIDSQVIKYNLGFAFICILTKCIAVHLLFLSIDITKQLIKKIKVWREQKKARQLQKQEAAQDPNQNKQLVELVLKRDRQVIANMEKGRKKFTQSKRSQRNTYLTQQQTQLPPIQEIEEPMSSRAIEADEEDQQPERILPNRQRRKRLNLTAADQDQTQGNIITVKTRPENKSNSIQPELSWVEKEKQRIRCQHFLLREVVYQSEEHQRTQIIEVEIPPTQQVIKPKERQFEGKRPQNAIEKELFDLL